VRVEVRPLAFDPWAEIARYQSGGPVRAGEHGATAVFVGTARDFSGADAVVAMELEHYPGMTERYLERLAGEALRRWALVDCLVIHRVGALAPGDPIVLVAAWAAHRAPAFEACRFLIDELKHRAPFWKRERLPDGERWVEGNA
jgi:molybdopterin synthase catalytic subunit